MPGASGMKGVCMKIVLCDDNEQDLLKIEEMVLEYKMSHLDRNIVLEKFSDPSRLRQSISEGNLADIYILDMLMPELTGIDLGNEIRKANIDSIIIYVTTSDDYALDAYGVHALRYILKPVSQEKLFEALDHSLSYKREAQDDVYLVKARGKIAQVRYSEIEYIENANRRLEVHMINGEILRGLVIRTSFEEETRDIAEKNNFQQVHKSFLVNLDYVKQLTQNSIVMKSGRKLPVSKARAAMVKREYLLYISGKYA